MKPVTTLKELLKPPFCRGRGIDSHYRIFMDTSTSPLVTVNYANFRNKKNEGKLFDDFCDFVAQALNEKWERDFGESLRWLRIWRDPEHKAEGSYLKCPKCNGVTWDEEDINHCTHCGVKLLPPEVKL